MAKRNAVSAHWHLQKPQMGRGGTTAEAILEQLRREWYAPQHRYLKSYRYASYPSIRFGGRALRPVHFHRFRRKRGLVQPDTLGRLLELRFAASIRGPLVLGFACHFGHCLFVPASDA